MYPSTVLVSPAFTYYVTNCSCHSLCACFFFPFWKKEKLFSCKVKYLAHWVTAAQGLQGLTEGLSSLWEASFMTRRPEETSCLGRFVRFYFLNPVFWDQFQVTLCFSVKLELDPFVQRFPPSGVVVSLLETHRTSTSSGGISAFVKMILFKKSRAIVIHCVLQWQEFIHKGWVCEIRFKLWQNLVYIQAVKAAGQSRGCVIV